MRRILLIVSSFLLAASLRAAEQQNLSKEELQKWMQEAFADAGKIPAEQRRAYAIEMLGTRGEREEQIRAELRAVAARPQYWPGYVLVTAAQRWSGRTAEQSEADRATAEEFLVELYRSRSGTADEAGINWQQGLAELLLLLGRADEALPLMQEVIVHDRDAYTSTLWAVVEKANGNDAPYASIMARCPEAPADNPDYCYGISVSIARRAVDLKTLDRTPALKQLLDGRNPGASWSARLTALISLVHANADSAEKELNAVYSSPRTTSDEKADLLLAQALLAMRRDQHERTTALLGCWLKNRGVSLPQATARTWEEIATLELLPEEKEKLTAEHAGCWYDQEIDPAGPCIVWVLEHRLEAAAKSGNQTVARQTIEQLAAIVTTQKAGTDNLWRMLWSYSSWLRPDESGFDFAKLIASRDAMATSEQREALRRNPKRLTQPWPSPTKVEAVESCP